jgi:predicted metalloprotease with PDZ domain
MKLIKFALALSFIFCLTGFVSAQSSGKKKIVVKKKITDTNGEVKIEEIILEGEEAEKYLMEKKKELGVDGNVTYIKKEMNMEGSQVKINEGKKIVIRVKEDNGESKVIEWNGEGEMPAEIKKHLEESNTDIDVEEMTDGQVRVVVRTSDEKMKLGIVPENHVDGVKVVDVVNGSKAEELGLQKDDIIYEVGGKMVGSSVQLSARLAEIGEGNSASISLLRNGEKKSVEIKQ